MSAGNQLFEYLKIFFYVFIACKRSLGQGNVFAPVCHSVQGGSLYDVTSCLAAWSHIPSGGSLSRGSLSGVSVQGGSLSGVSVGGGVFVQGGSLSGGSLSGGPPVWLRAGGTYPTGMHSCCLLFLWYNRNISLPVAWQTPCFLIEIRNQDVPLVLQLSLLHP